MSGFDKIVRYSIMTAPIIHNNVQELFSPSGFLGFVENVFKKVSRKSAQGREIGSNGPHIYPGDIAAKSPLVVIGTKRVLLQSRDLTVDQGLDYVATWNSGVLLSDDLSEATAAQQQKRKPRFAKL